MTDSYLQGEFLQVFAKGHKATAERIISRLLAAGVPKNIEAQLSAIVRDELRGLYHGNLVIFDGGSSLANSGLIKIVDDEGTPFVGHLHEIGLKAYEACE